MAPKLRKCTNLKCDFKCGLYHLAVEESFEQVIHEIWGRRFPTLEGQIKSADSAEIFQAFWIAIPVLPELLKCVVRAEATRSTDPDYSAIWIPGANREMAHHKLKTMSHGLSLVRMKRRFGIRVSTTYEEAAHAELRPGDNFIKVTVAKVYRIHPLPHGFKGIAWHIGGWGLGRWPPIKCPSMPLAKMSCWHWSRTRTSQKRHQPLWDHDEFRHTCVLNQLLQLLLPQTHGSNQRKTLGKLSCWTGRHPERRRRPLDLTLSPIKSKQMSLPKVQEQFASEAQASSASQYDNMITDHRLHRSLKLVWPSCNNKQFGVWFAETGTRLNA